MDGYEYITGKLVEARIADLRATVAAREASQHASEAAAAAPRRARPHADALGLANRRHRAGCRKRPICCAYDSWGGQRPSLAPYVTLTGTKEGVTASGGRSGCLSSRPSRTATRAESRR
jgi:hypothetical protein